MPYTPDWLPRNHQQLNNKLTLMWTYLSRPDILYRLGFLNREMSTTAPGTVIPPSFYTPTGTWLAANFTPRLKAYIKAYTAWLDPAKRSPEVNLALKVSEKDVKETTRQIYLYIKGHPLATPEDRLEMGFPLHDDTTATPAHTPTTWPIATPSTGGLGMLVFHYVDSHSNKRGKPKGIHGALLRWVISDAAPEHWDELVNKTFATSQPITLTFDVAMQGKALYYAMCWENTAGKLGPSSPIAKAIIS